MDLTQEQNKRLTTNRVLLRFEMLRGEYIKELGTSNIGTRYFHSLPALSDLHM